MTDLLVLLEMTFPPILAIQVSSPCSFFFSSLHPKTSIFAVRCCRSSPYRIGKTHSNRDLCDESWTHKYVSHCPSACGDGLEMYLLLGQLQSLRLELLDVRMTTWGSRVLVADLRISEVAPPPSCAEKLEPRRDAAKMGRSACFGEVRIRSYPTGCEDNHSPTEWHRGQLDSSCNAQQQRRRGRGWAGCSNIPVTGENATHLAGVIVVAWFVCRDN